MWQHVKLSEQIRPRDTLACCWSVKQASNQQTITSVNPLAFSFFCTGRKRERLRERERGGDKGVGRREVQGVGRGKRGEKTDRERGREGWKYGGGESEIGK